MKRAFIVFIVLALSGCVSQSDFGTGVDAVLGGPTITLSSAISGFTNDATIAVTLTSNENITGLIAGDFTCTNCTVTAVVGSGVSYTVTVDPTADGVVSVLLPSATVIDAYGNTNSVSNTLNWTYDTTAAAVSNVSPFHNAQLNSLTATLSGGCETGATISISGNIIGGPIETNCVSSLFSTSITLTAANVNQDIEITQEDLAGNVSAAADFTFHALTIFPSEIHPSVGHTCSSMSDNSIRCWGSNGDGQLGDNTTVAKALPTAVNMGAFSGNPAAISSGGSLLVQGSGHTCAIDGANQVLCWGVDNYGQLGTGVVVPAPDQLIPVVSDALADAASIELGGGHSCYLNSIGEVFCTGANSNGQSGTDPTAPNAQLEEFTIVQGALSLAGTTVTNLTAGENHTCAVREFDVSGDTSVFCWGNNSSGQLGNDSVISTHEPAQVLYFVEGGPNAVLEEITSVVAGERHSCALTLTGTVWCWGDNSSNQLGNTAQGGAASDVAVQVSGITTATQIFSAANHTCALTDAGTLFCWGANNKGQLGDQTTTSQSTPVAFKNILNTAALSGIVGVSTGAEHTCVRLSFGSVLCVGEGSSGELGDNLTADSTVPVITDFRVP